jgi:hypothetical protein
MAINDGDAYTTAFPIDVATDRQTIHKAYGFKDNTHDAAADTRRERETDSRTRDENR